MVPFYVHAERSEPQRYRYRVGSNQCTTLMADDHFKFNIKAYLNTTPPTLLLYSPFHTIPCHRFFQDGQFLWGLLSRIHYFIESLEEIIEAVTSDVRELFQVNGVASPSSESKHREIPIWLEVTLFDTSLLLATEEFMQCFRMIPASNEAIKFLLKKSTVMTGDKCCPICLEELDANAECRTMPCDHMYHQQCIVSWLQINHVCPVCRYSLPTLKN